MNKQRAIAILADSVKAKTDEIAGNIAHNLIDKFSKTRPEQHTEFDVTIKLTMNTDLLFEIERQCDTESKDKKLRRLLQNRFRNGNGRN